MIEPSIIEEISFYVTVILAVVFVCVGLMYLRKRKLKDKGHQSRIDDKFPQGSPQKEPLELPRALRGPNSPTARGGNNPETFSSTMIELIRRGHYVVELEGTDNRCRTAIDLGGGAKVKIKSIKPNPNINTEEESQEESEQDEY